MIDLLLLLGLTAVFPIFAGLVYWRQRRRGDGSGSGSDAGSTSAGADAGPGDTGSCDSSVGCD